MWRRHGGSRQEGVCKQARSHAQLCLSVSRAVRVAAHVPSPSHADCIAIAEMQFARAGRECAIAGLNLAHLLRHCGWIHNISGSQPESTFLCQQPRAVLNIFGVRSARGARPGLATANPCVQDMRPWQGAQSAHRTQPPLVKILLEHRKTLRDAATREPMARAPPSGADFAAGYVERTTLSPDTPANARQLTCCTGVRRCSAKACATAHGDA